MTCWQPPERGGGKALEPCLSDEEKRCNRISLFVGLVVIVRFPSSYGALISRFPKLSIVLRVFVRRLLLDFAVRFSTAGIASCRRVEVTGYLDDNLSRRPTEKTA